MPVSADEGRKRGRIEIRGENLRVIVYAGQDPVIGRRSYLRKTVKGNDRAAYRKANSEMAALIAEVERQETTSTSAPLGHVLDEWLRVVELEDSTRETYQGYVDRTIRPALGDTPIRKITPRVLERLSAELRRCRTRCDGKPFVEHRVDGLHDCVKAECQPHACKPLAISTVRQIHAVISGALSAAVRWDWLPANPARIAQRPRQKPPQPEPPSTEDAARLVEAAFQAGDEWGTLVWLVMTTGMRRGEVCALRWKNVDLENGVIEIRNNFVKRKGVGTLKDTKTHQMRRIALDTEPPLCSPNSAGPARPSAPRRRSRSLVTCSSSPARATLTRASRAPRPASPAATSTWRRNSTWTPTFTRSATTPPPNC